MLKKRYFKTKDVVEITFEHADEQAAQVVLVTEANEWEPVKMTRRKKDGVFYTKLRLPKDSEFQFRYLVDDQSWVNDSAADAYVANEYGGQNAVVATTK
jgi:1,4-alpha-glucan branching enzyme